MNLKQLINKSVYGTIGYISSQDDLDLLESYIMYNLTILKEFKQIVVATNYSKPNSNRINNEQLWKKYFPNCIMLHSNINRGHSFGTADLDNILFDFCKENEIDWLCKSANDMLFDLCILNQEIEEADFYHLNGFSHLDLFKNNFDYDKIYNEHFYPQTNFYFINVSKCDYLNNKQYLDDTFYIVKTPNYTGKIWEYLPEWSCETFLKKCVLRNNLKKQYLLSQTKHNELCNLIHLYKIGDPSHKNIMINGIGHIQFPNEPVIQI